MSKSATIRIFIVDDHPVVRSGLRTMIESAGDMSVIGVAASAQEALSAEFLPSADVLLADLRMPGKDGLQFIAELRERHRSIKVAVLTNYHSDEDVFRAFEAGAMAYLLKTASDVELFDAIRKIQSGQRCIPEAIAVQLAERLGRTQLTARELEILDYVSHGLTNREIGELLQISDKTVRNHVINCLDKLGAKDRTEATAMALRRGLIGASNS